MSWLFAAVYDRLSAAAEAGQLGRWRADLLGGLEGDVLEIGAGTGRNLAHYPAAVRRLTLSEPDAAMRVRLCRTMARSGAGRDVEVVEAAADDLPVDDASVDTVVSTLVLCSVPDPVAALAETRRVLRPGGHLAVIEHVAADEGRSTRRWQARAEPVWRHLAGGCRLTRSTEDVIAAAGFDTAGFVRAPMPGQPLLGPVIRGLARRPA